MDRRRRSVGGRHIYLRCNEWDAGELVERYLEDILPALARHADMWVQLSLAGPKLSFDWQSLETSRVDQQWITTIAAATVRAADSLSGQISW